MATFRGLDSKACQARPCSLGLDAGNATLRKCRPGTLTALLSGYSRRGSVNPWRLQASDYRPSGGRRHFRNSASNQPSGCRALARYALMTAQNVAVAHERWKRGRAAWTPPASALYYAERFPGRMVNGIRFCDGVVWQIARRVMINLCRLRAAGARGKARDGRYFLFLARAAPPRCSKSILQTDQER